MISHPTDDFNPNRGESLKVYNERSAEQMVLRDQAAHRPLLRRPGLLEPGVVPVAQWRPDSDLNRRPALLDVVRGSAQAVTCGRSALPVQLGRSFPALSSGTGGGISSAQRAVACRGGLPDGGRRGRWQAAQDGGCDVAVGGRGDRHEPVPRADRGADVDAEVGEDLIHVVHGERDDLPAATVVGVGGGVHERELADAPAGRGRGRGHLGAEPQRGRGRRGGVRGEVGLDLRAGRPLGVVLGMGKSEKEYCAFGLCVVSPG